MPRKRVFFHLVAAGLMLVSIEVSAAIATRLMVRWGWMAWIPRVSPERIKYYMAHHNPVLGWGPALDAHGRVVHLEARADPAVEERAPACVSAYGDSFTAGSEVEDAGTYPHYLGLRLGCRVANYGVGAYGTDQALMLFRAQQGLDAAPVVVLGHVSEDIMRNVNQYRVLAYPGDGQDLSFKPVFALRHGELQFVPVPVNTEADFHAFERDPDRFLEFDAFRSRPRRTFPYTLALARWVFTDFHFHAHLAGIPRYTAFYAPSDPSRALEVTVSILQAFASEARTRGQHPFVLLIPIGRDFLYHQRTGVWVDQPLADALGAGDVPAIHAGPLMAAQLGSADPCSLFNNCYRHFNARGYKMLADVAGEAIQRAHLAQALSVSP